MSAADNLQPRLFGVGQYNVGAPQVEHGPPLPEDPDDAFMRRLIADEDRGTHLRMFEQAGVLARSRSAEKPDGVDQKDFANRKLRESRNEIPDGSGFPARPGKGENTTYESVRKYGVQTPVLVAQQDYSGQSSYELQHGHHRVYTSNAIDPGREIPLTHTISRWSGERAKNVEIVRAASAISMGGRYVEGGWQDPTINQQRR